MPFEGRMLKIVDSIEGDLRSIYFPKYYKSIIITAGAKSAISLTFDIRDSYASAPESGREYRMEERDGIIWVSYPLEKIVIGIKIHGGYKIIDKWVEREYPLDAARHSSPSKLWVYEGIELVARKACIAVGQSEREVQKELARAMQFRIKKSPAFVKLKKDGHNSALASRLAKFSLLSLRVFNDKKKLIGLYGGLPWFFQFWPRDEAIAMTAFAPLMYKEAKQLASRRVLLFSGRKPFPAIINLSGEHSELQSIDGSLWWMQKLKKLKVKDVPLELDAKFVMNGAKETWMDSIPREGARIEIQALKLALMRGAPVEKEFSEHVKKSFFNGELLADGIEPDGQVDKTIRPNCFLAYYIYPDLLSSEEWETVFDLALSHLWCAWGGFATLEKFHPEFCGAHTGQDAKSYHQGDSWFWINNLAAIALNRVNSEKYRQYTQQILDASARDLLSCGIPGHASELSSANEFAPSGSPVQLWSSATFIELFEELKLWNGKVIYSR